MKRVNETYLFILALLLFFVAAQTHDGYGSVIIGMALIAAWFWPIKKAPISLSLPLSRHMKLKRNGGSHTSEEWAALCEKYNWRCVSCGKKSPLTKDHIVSVDQGGTDDIANIQPLCKPCNSRKKNKTFRYKR